MTSRPIYVFAFILVAFSIVGCSKQVDKAEGLPGYWEWKSTDGGLGNHLHQTPASTGKREQLKLTSNLQYFKYLDGDLIEEGTYTLVNRTCIHDQKEKTVIKFSASTQDLMVESVDRQQLVLSEENFDGVQIIYERKNSKDK